MNKSQANAIHKAYDLYWKILGMAGQLEANGLSKEAAIWKKASEVIVPSVAEEVKRIEEERDRKISYHKSQMRPEVLQQTEALDRVGKLEAENAALRAKAVK